MSNLRFYNQNALAFCEATIHNDMRVHYARFLAHVRPGSHILDAGCGSGRDARHFLELGYSVTAFDASETMCQLAAAHLGQAVPCLRFEEMTWCEAFDAIWACASLLHVPLVDLPDVFKRLHTALRPGGILYASFKYGHGETRRGERTFTDFTENTLKDQLLAAGLFEILELFVTTDVRPDHAGEAWVNVIAVKG